MKRVPKRGKNVRGQVSHVQSIAAPIGGWNARDPLANMPPSDAVKLLNWFPTPTDCEIRGGNVDHATLTGTCETLAVYNAMDGTTEMYAVSDTDVYDVSSAGVGVAKTLTVTDGKFQWDNFGDGTSNWLIMVNGVDTPKYWNGAAWVQVTGATSPAITGITTTDIVHLCVYHNRLYFLETNSLSFWYMPAGAAGGAATEFDLSSYASKGGFLMWAATISFDGGEGLDDYIVFMTSQGQAIVYAGTDPSTASAWILKGVYNLGKPLGRRSFEKFGGDLIAVTQNGALPMSKVMQGAENIREFAITDKIQNSFNEAALNYGSNFGWDVTTYPLKSAMIFNIPVTVGGTHKQYVMNTITKAWGEFDSWDGECFVIFNDELYFGASGVVQKAWNGTDDDGSNIVAIGKTAFNYFEMTSQSKKFNLFRPMLQTNGSISFLTGIDIDYSDNEITGLASYTTSASGVWDTGLWDSAFWAAGLEISKQWTSPAGNTGYCVSGGIKIETNSLIVKWTACDFVFETGGVIG
jgi:hypothetical protein